MYRTLIVAVAALTFLVIVVGAYVRLADAGLGCPDWPGCYGRLTPRSAQAEIARAVAEQGGTHGPVSLPKAWTEMGHRYVAGALGILVAIVAMLAWTRRISIDQSPMLATALLVLVILQALLGMWTVTLLLKPVIVMLHLAGGMTLLAMSTWLALRQFAVARGHVDRALVKVKPWSTVTLIVAAMQILLGGWVSANYAALACTDLPTCRGEWWPSMDVLGAFQFRRKLGMTATGDLLSNEALIAIHMAHRIGAVITLAASLFLAHRLLREQSSRMLGWLLAAAVCAQFGLGVLNVVLSLPLALAAAHTAGAAALLVVIVVINYFAHHPASRLSARA
jgi:cytochrome c oxidase assembly protein subunit 15